MRVSQYTLGILFYGKDGLLKYSFDLTCEESKQEDDINFIYRREHALLKKLNKNGDFTGNIILTHVVLN